MDNRFIPKKSDGRECYDRVTKKSKVSGCTLVSLPKNTCFSGETMVKCKLTINIDVFVQKQGLGLIVLAPQALLGAMNVS